MCSNILCNDSRVIGLSRISRNTPVFPASTCVSAVTATTGMLLQSADSAIRRANSNPFMPGIHKSVSTASNRGVSRSNRSASSPEPAQAAEMSSFFSMASRTFRFRATSSTSSTRRQAVAAGSGAGAAEGGSAVSAAGSSYFRLSIRTVKVVPEPGTLASSIRPPILSTSRREIASPSPDPS